MDAAHFRTIWMSDEDALTVFDPESLTGLDLKSSTIHLLTAAGLPLDASPFLSFVQDKQGVRRLTAHFSFLSDKYDRYIVIGSCNDGDIIAIDTLERDEVVWLDHEERFTSRFFNSSLEALLECLVIYREFVETILRDNGESAFLEAQFSDHQFEDFKQKLAAADPYVVVAEGFWKSDIEMLLATRQQDSC